MGTRGREDVMMEAEVGTVWLLTWKKAFPGSDSGKESSCQGRRHKSHGFNPWVRKEERPFPLVWKILWTEEPGGL